MEAEGVARCCVTLLSVVLAAGASGAGASAGFARDAATVVVSYTEVLGEIGEADAGPSVHVHGDGRVRVHYPAYMTRAGDWELQLSAEELLQAIAEIIKCVLALTTNFTREFAYEKPLQ